MDDWTTSVNPELLHPHHHTLLLQIPGDGRELVVTDPNAVKVRAEDGRRVEAVDITPFINNLPYGMPLPQQLLATTMTLKRAILGVYCPELCT